MTGRMTYKRALLWLIDHDDPTEIDPAAIRLSSAVALAEMIYGYTHNIPETIARARREKYDRDPAFRFAVDRRAGARGSRRHSDSALANRRNHHGSSR